MPPKKSAVAATGIGIGEPQNDITRKPVTRKLSAGNKRPTRVRQVIKVKVVSPKSIISKKKEARMKLFKEKRNGVGKRKPPRRQPKPIKIKRTLTRQEKIAFANQVAQAQLVKGTTILEEPAYVPMDPPMGPPAVNPVRKKVGRKRLQSSLQESEPAAPEVSLVQTNGVVKKLVRRRQAQHKVQPDTEVTTEESEPAAFEDSLPQANSVIKKAGQRKKLVRRRRAQHTVEADNKVTTDAELQESEPAASEVSILTNSVMRKKAAPRKKLVRRRPAQHTVEADSGVITEAATLAEDLPPAKRGPGRPKKTPQDSDSAVSSPRSRGKKLISNLAQSTDDLSDTTREAKRIEDSLTRPESKVSDTFSWAEDISTSTSNSLVPIDGKLPALELIDYRKFPKVSVNFSHASLSDTMKSPRKRKASQSPAKSSLASLSDPMTSPEKRKALRSPRTHSDKQKCSETDKQTAFDKKRSRNAKYTENKDETNRRSKRSTEKRSLSAERRRKEKAEEIERLERERLRIQGLLKEFEFKWCAPEDSKSKEKKLKILKPVDPARHCVASSSAERKVKSRPRAPSKRCLRSDKDNAKDTPLLPSEIQPESLSPSLNLTSSASISMSESTSLSATSNESEQENKMAAVLKSLRRTLNNIDLEFLHWLAKEDDHETEKPISDITFKVLKHEAEAIKICQKFKRGIPDLSSSEKSVENKSVGSADMQPSGADFAVDTAQDAAEEPVDVPDAPTVEEKWPNYVYNDLNSENVESQQEYCDDGDDVISLFAESISGFDSIRNSVRSSMVASPFEEVRQPILPQKTVPTPVEKAPHVVKTKTAAVQRQNADSSTYHDPSSNVTDSIKTVQNPAVIERAKQTEDRPLFMADIYKTTLSHLSSTVFQGYCFFNLISKCKKTACVYPHVIPDSIVIKNKLTNLSEQNFICEYLLLRRNPPLRNRFMVLYVDECQKRDLTRFLVEMASDAKREEATVKTYVMETTLLHLNDKDLEICKDILISPLTGHEDLCDVFMKTIADTQNFSRFKAVFVNLTKFIVQRHRKIDLEVATQIFERICILPYEESLAQAAILLLKSTKPSIFENSLMSKFLERLALNNKAACNDLVKYREILQANSDVQLSMKPSVENVRYTSPDTTHLDGLQTKPLDDAAAVQPKITRTFTPAFTHTPEQRGYPPLALPVPPVPLVPPVPPAWRRDRFRGSPGWGPRGRAAYRVFRRPGPSAYRWP